MSKKDSEHPKLPDILYHYTTASAFQSIVETAQIWATNVRFLNDTSELNYAIERAGKLWNQSPAKHPSEYRKICMVALSVGFNYTYIVSFSEMADDLSQWRAYARPGGLCIGFSRAALEKSFNDAAEMSGIERCHYDKKSLDDMLLAKRSEIDASIASSETVDDRLANDAFDLLLIASSSKNPSFVSEREVRLVFYPDMEEEKYTMGFHTKNGIVVPHYEIPRVDVGKAPWIKRVVVGPTPNPDGAEWGVRELLREHDLSAADVVSSKIPYRDW